MARCPELPVLARNAFRGRCSTRPGEPLSDVSNASVLSAFRPRRSGCGRADQYSAVQIRRRAPSASVARPPTAPMDAVQEFSIQQNSVDAESGFSAAAYERWHEGWDTSTTEPLLFRRQSDVQHAVRRLHASSRTQVCTIVGGGGRWVGPIRKNKLFTFFATKNGTTANRIRGAYTPHGPGAPGDFSQSLTKAGAVRPIYDPLTTQFIRPANSPRGRRSPAMFIPARRIDPTSRLF